MSTTATASPARIGRTILLALGLVAIAFGVTILFWPTKTAIALTGIIAFQAIVGGIIYLARGLTAKELGKLGALA